MFAVSDGAPIIEVREFGRQVTDSASSAGPLRQQLLTFNVEEHSRCYDPNEQVKLLEAIRSTFSGTLCDLFRIYIDINVQKETTGRSDFD